MASLLKRFSVLPRSSRVFILSFFFGVVIIALLMIGSAFSSSRRQEEVIRQQVKLEELERVYRKQVKRLTMKRKGADGEDEIIEIQLTGHVNIYELNGDLKKAGIQGFFKVDSLLDKVDRMLDEDVDVYSSIPIQGCSITVETNSGIVYIPCEDNEELVDEIETVVDETLNPTPTLIPVFSPTAVPPSSTPGPSPTLGPPTATPTPTGPGPTPTPTPLPDYMTAPPFTCEAYAALGRPVAISQTVCGAD